MDNFRCVDPAHRAMTPLVYAPSLAHWRGVPPRKTAILSQKKLDGVAHAWTWGRNAQGALIRRLHATGVTARHHRADLRKAAESRIFHI